MSLSHWHLISLGTSSRQHCKNLTTILKFAAFSSHQRTTRPFFGPPCLAYRKYTCRNGCLLFVRRNDRSGTIGGGGRAALTARPYVCTYKEMSAFRRLSQTCMSPSIDSSWIAITEVHGPFAGKVLIESIRWDVDDTLHSSHYRSSSTSVVACHQK